MLFGVEAVRIFSSIRNLFESLLLSRPSVVEAFLSCPNPFVLPPVVSVIEEARIGLADILGCDHSSLRPSHKCSPVRGHLLAALCRAVEDPDIDAAEWFISGAPVGIGAPIPSCNVFPPKFSITDELDSYGCSCLQFIDANTDFSALSNYVTADSLPEVTLNLLAKEVEQGFCDIFRSFSDLSSSLGCSKIVTTKLGLVPKSGSDQYRLICDATENHLNSKISLPEHVILPRVSDAVDCLLSLREQQFSLGGTLDGISIDFSSAFKLVPLAEAERPFHVVFFQDRWYAYNTLLFGFSSSPLIWCREAGLIARSACGLCQAPSDHPESSKSTFALNVFVDDPFAQARAPSARYARVMLCLPLLLWAALGFRLAISKRQAHFPIKWIGVVFDIHPVGIKLQIPDDKLKSALTLVSSALARCRISVKLLRKICGKFAWIGQIVPFVHAFVSPLWKLLGQAERSMWSWVFVKGIKYCLVWLKTFIHSHFGSSPSPYVRVFPCESKKTSPWSMVVDASTTGVGGVLYNGSTPVSWFADILTENDFVMFDSSERDCKRQSLWEALALLIATRLWLPKLPPFFTVKCCSDSKTAIGSMMSFKSRSTNLIRIAQELALDCALSGRWFNLSFSHLPGVLNGVADALSRLGEGCEVPLSLRNVPRSSCPDRSMASGFWRVPNRF